MRTGKIPGAFFKNVRASGRFDADWRGGFRAESLRHPGTMHNSADFSAQRQLFDVFVAKSAGQRLVTTSRVD